jgi:L1 cell adhesion molecule like protein
MPRGAPQIEITYDVDANGILNVSAAEKSTGKTNKITITNDKGRLSKEQIEKMVEEASKYEEDDKKRMETIEAKNDLESYLYNARNSFREDKVKQTLGEDAERGASLAEEGIKWLDSNTDASTETYKEKKKEMEETLRPLLMKMYGAKDMSGSGSEEGNMPGMHGQEQGPKVEEVD